MSQIAEAYVQIIPTTKGIGNSIVNEFSGIGGAAGNAMGGSLLATAGKFAAPLLAAFGAVQIGQFFADAVRGGSTLNESLNALSVSFGDASDEIASLGETAAKRLGISNREFNGLAVRFSAFAKTIVGEGGDVAKLIDDLTTRGADFASVYDLEVADALTLFQSGLAGETEPLRRFGIDLSAAAVEAFALANGIWDGAGAMTETEKIQARYGALLQQTAQTEGDRANTAGSFANAQRTLNAVLQDTTDRIGIALLPALESLLPTLTATIEQFVADPAFNDFITNLGTGFNNLLVPLPGVLQNMNDFGKDALPAVNSFFPVLNEALSLLGSVFLGIEETDPASTTNDFAAAMRNLSGAFDGIAGALKNIKTWWEALPPLFRMNFFEIMGLIMSFDGKKWADAGIPMPFGTGPTPNQNYAPGKTKGLPGAATGGTVTRAGSLWVGEEGPEILNLPRAASIVPLDRAMGTGNQPIYTDAGALVGWMQSIAGREARLVWNTADLENAVMV